MKIIKCHIEGFGKLQKIDLNFDSKFNQFLYQNGEGKTTISDFIFAMFYGMKSVKKNTVEFMPRKRYYPFNNGLFGGNISFEYNNDIYKIERFFDASSDTKDTLVIYKNDNIFDIEGNIPGEYFFKLNEQSFLKLLYISTKDISMETNSDINKQLNNDLYQLDSSFDLNNILAILDKDVIKPKALKEIKEDIKNKENRLLNLYAITSQRNLKNTNLDDVEKEIKKYQDKYTEAANNNKIVEQQKNLKTIIDDIKLKEKEKNNILQKYHDELPNNINEIEDSLKNKNNAELLIQSNDLSADEKRYLNYLKQKYENNLPEDSYLEEIKDNIETYNANRTREESILNNSVNKHPLFAKQEPTTNFINELENLKNLYDLKFNEYQGLADLNLKPQIKKTNKKLYLLLALFSLILLVSGGLLFLVNMIPAIICLILGFIVLLADGFIYLNNNIKNNQPNNQAIYEKENFRINTLEPLEKQINAKLNQYGFYDQNIALSFERFKHEYENYLKDKSEEEQTILKINAYREENKKLMIKFDDLFNKYNIDNKINYYDKLNSLKQEIKDYKMLSSKNDYLKELNQDNKEKIEKANLVIDSFKQKYNLDVNKNTIDMIKEDLVKIDQTNKSIENLKQKYTNYKEENHLDNIPEQYDEIDISLITEKLNELAKQKTILNHELADIDDAEKEIEDLENELSDIKDNLDKINHKNFIIEQTKKLLNQTDELLSEKMIGPVKKRFIEYAKVLEHVLGKTIAMDKNYRIQYEQNGSNHPIEHLSSGELTLCALCYRLAMLKEMFNENNPFVILDDPFVYLDDEALQKAKTLLEQINDYQIIYFTCHESRKLNI